MNNIKAKKVLQKVAKNNDVSVAEVQREINIAITEAMRNPDSKIQERWKSIPHKGEIPTSEEVLLHLTKQVERNPANII